MTSSGDTGSAIERILIERLRRLSSREKGALISALCRAVQRISVAGIRSRHPDASEREIRLRLASLRLDRETMVRVFGWDPQEKGYG